MLDTTKVYTVALTSAGPLIVSGARHEDNHVTSPEWILGDTTAVIWRDTHVEALRDAYNTAQQTLFAASEAFHRACNDNLLLASLLFEEEVRQAKGETNVRMD